MRIIQFILFMLLAGAGFSQTIKNIQPDEFKKAMNSENVIVIDLRTDDEIIKRGMIKGAIQINWLGNEAEQEIDKLDKTKTFLVYCAGGGRSAECAEYMQKKGFTKIYNLEKGFDDWKKKGFEIVNR